MATDFYRSYPWKQLRRQAKIRDDFRCQRCGAQPGAARLDVDHRVAMVDDPRLALTLSNTVTLCRRCHNAKTAADAKRRRAGEVVVCRYHGPTCTSPPHSRDW